MSFSKNKIRENNVIEKYIEEFPNDYEIIVSDYGRQLYFIISKNMYVETICLPAHTYIYI